MNKKEHLLACLIEECSEVQKEATKALRFGLDDVYGGTADQAEKIQHEFCDLLAIVEMMRDEGMLPEVSVADLISKKKDRVVKYMRYAEERGALDSQDLLAL